jgi:peroxin-19
LSKDDKEKYEKQLEYVRKIIGVFEAPGYDDKSEESSKVIVELMSEVS